MASSNGNFASSSTNSDNFNGQPIELEPMRNDMIPLFALNHNGDKVFVKFCDEEGIKVLDRYRYIEFGEELQIDVLPWENFKTISFTRVDESITEVRFTFWNGAPPMTFGAANDEVKTEWKRPFKRFLRLRKQPNLLWYVGATRGVVYRVLRDTNNNMRPRPRN